MAIKPLFPGTAKAPNKRAGPPMVWGHSSGWGDTSVEAYALLVQAKARNGGSGDVDAVRLYHDTETGMAYAVPCNRTAPRAYEAKKEPDNRSVTFNLLEVYDAFEMTVAPGFVADMKASLQQIEIEEDEQTVSLYCLAFQAANAPRRRLGTRGRESEEPTAAG